MAIGEGTVPSGAVEGITSFGKSDDGGPCPPSGTHRYFFKLYALNVKINLDQKADKSRLEQAVKDRIIAQAQMIGLYQGG